MVAGRQPGHLFAGVVALFAGLALPQLVTAATPEVNEASEAYPKAYGLYVDLHEHPELSTRRRERQPSSPASYVRWATP